MIPETSALDEGGGLEHQSGRQASVVVLSNRLWEGNKKEIEKGEDNRTWKE